jgi:endogenous inhibitor of DNA gyrase (YacG/DUF329 family)
MEKNCDYCGNGFEAERSTRKYCSDKCKKLAFLTVLKEEQVLRVTVPKDDLTVPETVVSVPKKNDKKVTVPYLDVVKDLGLSLEKDLGVFGMTSDGIFIRDDITVEQVRNIRRLVEAKKGWLHRKYDEGGSGASTIPRCPQRV